MLTATRVGDVTEIRMGRSLDGSTVLYWVAAYLIDGILIDSGCDYTKEELAEYLTGKPVSKIVNTHYHEDHVGGNAILGERFGLRALAHPETIRLMSGKYDLYPYQSQIWGYPDPCTADPIEPTFNERGVSLCVIETPGHCRGHISFFEQNRGILFSGDLWVGERPKTARTEENEHQIIADLRKFEELRPKMMFASLGKIVTNPTDVIKRTRMYLEDMRDKILKLHSAGKSSEQIRNELFGRESVLAEITQHQLSTKIFVESFLRNA